MGVFNEIIGTSGSDTINGTPANDFILAQQGNDIVFGFDGNDSLLGNQQDDQISGNNGNDTIFGGKGNDSLFGNQGNDSLFGNKDQDTIFGGQGNDSLFGGEGNDSLLGDPGNDVLFGDLGADTLQGGAGRDKFVLALRSDGAATSGGSNLANADFIDDFEDGQDLIGLDNLSFDQLIIETASNNVSNTVIRVELQGLGNQFLAILEGIDPSQITAEDFTTDLSAITGDAPTPTPPTPTPPTPIPPTPPRPPVPPTPPTPPNLAPNAFDDFANTFENAAITINVLGNDSDPDGDAIAIDSFAATSTAGGTIVEVDGNLRYTPSAGFTGTDTFTYTVADPEGLIDTATVTVTVADVPNQNPVANDDSATTLENQAISINVVFNDSDPDGDSLSINQFSAESANGGQIVRAGNALRYTPAAGFIGTDTFSYTVGDGNGGTDTATVTVNVLDGNRAPVAVEDFATTNIGTPITINVVANDSDADNDPLSISGFEATTASGGTIAQNANGLEYTPADGFAGFETFTYTITDGRAFATTTVGVTVNTPPEPIQEPQTEFFADLNTSITLSILDNFTDADGDTLSILFESTTGEGGAIALVNGSLEYTPASGFVGDDTFIYTVSDSRGGNFPVQVTVNVTDNQAPVAVDDTTTTVENAAVAIDVLANDFDVDGPDEQLEIFGFAVTSAEGGTIARVGDELEYTPATGFTGTDTFSYTINDLPGDTAVATVTVTVNSLNNPPEPMPDATTTAANANVAIDVLANDSDPDGDDVLLAAFTETTGEGGTVTRDRNGTPFDRSDDLLVYSPAPGFAGEDTFAYTVGDGNGGFAATTVTVTVLGGDPPDAEDDESVIVRENVASAIPVLLNDSGGADVELTVIGVEGATSGTVEVSADGTSVIYTPDAGFTGTDSFTYEIRDSNGLSDTATVELEVQPAGDNDSLEGGAVADLLIGDRVRVFEDPLTPEATETLVGGAGDDTIIGREGSDILVGGMGADDFLYFDLAESGNDPAVPIEPGDAIIDFNPAQDRIGLLLEIDGNPVTDANVSVGLIPSMDESVALVRIIGTTFQIRLTNLDPDTTAAEISDSLFFLES